MIKRERNLYSKTKNFGISWQQLDLKINQEGFYEVEKSISAEKIAEETHLQTIHGRVTLTMVKIKDQY